MTCCITFQVSFCTCSLTFCQFTLAMFASFFILVCSLSQTYLPNRNFHDVRAQQKLALAYHPHVLDLWCGGWHWVCFLLSHEHLPLMKSQKFLECVGRPFFFKIGLKKEAKGRPFFWYPTGFINTFKKFPSLCKHPYLGMRIGEAKNPGPVGNRSQKTVWAIVNPTSIYSKVEEFRDLIKQYDIGIISCSETSATSATQKTFTAALKKMDFIHSGQHQ